MPRVSTALHLPVVFDGIIRQLANYNDKYKFSAYPYSVLQEFAFDSEVILTSYSEIARKLHTRCTFLVRISKRSASITDELDIPWDPGIGSASVGMSWG